MTIAQLLHDRSKTVFEWPSQSIDLNSTSERFEGGGSPSNLMDLETICQEEWDKPWARFEKLEETHPRNFDDIISAKCVLQCSEGSEYFFKVNFFSFVYIFKDF